MVPARFYNWNYKCFPNVSDTADVAVITLVYFNVYGVSNYFCSIYNTNLHVLIIRITNVGNLVPVDYFIKFGDTHKNQKLHLNVLNADVR